MEVSESICVPNPNNEDSELEFSPSKSPNSGLDHAPSDDPNRTAEDHTPVLHDELQKLDLKEESEPVSKEEGEKDGNWDLKEVEREQCVEKEKGDSNWEEGKGGESGWDDWNVNVNGNEIENEIEKVVVVEVVSSLSVPEVEVEVEESGERNDNGSANTKRHQYQYPVRPEAEDCSFYLKTGTCMFASNCKFNHPVRRKNQVPVPALKEQIASVTGVLSDQQRLICRGKVLKDDQLLSAYHVEDGHTLHLVVRQPFLPSSEGLSNHSATDPALSTSRGQSNQVAPGLVIEAFSAVQGDSVPPEINRIVSAVLGSFGITNVVSGGEGTDVREHGAQNPTQLQSEQLGGRGPPDRSHSTYGLPSAVSLGTLQPPVIHDSLTTLSQYLSLMRHEFGAIVAGRGGGNGAQAAATHGNGERGPDSTLPTATVQEGFPTPASLAEVMLSTRQMLIEHAGECILQLARQLEDQVNVTDPSVRLSTQSNVRRAGFLIHNLGALLLELGRTTMTLRLGQTPSEAVVNAGPAVFISPSGPNPIMVQPLPFQPGTSLGAIPMGGVQPGSGLVNGLGTGFVPRRIDIQIRRGTSATTPNVSREEPSDTQQPFGPRNSTTNSGGENPIITSNSRVSEGPSFGGESGVQVVPTRTMIAAVPGPFSRLPSDSAGNLIGLYYPVLGRFQHVASGLVSGEQGSQATGERHSAGLQTEQRTDSAAQQHNIDGPARDESFPTPYLRQQEPSNAHSGNINILSADGTQNSQESDGHLPSSVMQFLRTLFPGGEIRVEEASSEGTGRGSVSEHVGTSGGVVNAPEAEPRASDEGIFLSNLLHQIIPLISEQAGAEPDARPTEAANASENTIPRDSSTQADSDVGTSRRPNDGETSPPNSKRLKME